jgi:hypothetical protein
MSAPINDGGPAFPVIYDSSGMTLRDYFAGQALEGILSKAINPNDRGNDSVNWASTNAPGPTKAANSAYEYADAMLAARKGEQ